MTEQLQCHISLSCIGEGSGNPLLCSCLENPRDGGAWWAAIYGVAQSRTQPSDFTFIFHFPLSCIGEGNGNPLQCPCLENPRDGGAWWAVVYRVAQSQTRLKQLSSSSSSKWREKGPNADIKGSWTSLILWTHQMYRNMCLLFLTQGSNLCLLCLLHCQVDPLPLQPRGKPL